MRRRSIADYTLDRISAELDAIFGFDPIPEQPVPEPRGDHEPPFFFGRSLTPREGVLLHSLIFTSLGEEDKFLKDMIRYWQQKEYDASRAKSEKDKRTNVYKKRKRR